LTSSDFCVIGYAMGQAGTERCRMPRKSRRVLPGKRYPLNMRTTKELRDKIEAAATFSGRSLVQEVEARLEESFLRQNLAALMREHIENTAKAVADQLINRLKEQGK
jgi:Arc-like DNA binding domain